MTDNDLSEKDTMAIAKIGCCSCLWSLSIIAAIPIGIGLLGNTRTILDDEEFQLNCIEPYDDNITIQPPNDLEFDILNVSTLSMMTAFVLACFITMCNRDSENGQQQTSLCGCVLMLAAFVSASLFFHIYIYTNLLNTAFKESSPLDCYMHDEWQVAYDWAVAGVWVGGCVVGLFCCIFYVMIMAFSGSDDESPTYTAAKTNATSITMPSHPSKPNIPETRTVAIQNTNTGGDGTQLTEAERALVGGLVSLKVIDKLGFSIATTMNKFILLAILQEIDPSGQTALRDAMALSILKMITLKSVLDEINVIGHQFIHIVLTDGVDNKSSCSLTDIQGFYQKIGASIGDKYFKTFFIGIDLGFQEKRELQSIADLAGDAAELFNCKDVQLSDIFDRIKLSLGIQRRVALITDGTSIVGAAKDTLYLQAERQKFLVLFDLDMSGSMSGSRWDSLQGALASFFSGLDDSDIIGCVLFNHEAKCITGEVLSNALQSI